MTAIVEQFAFYTWQERWELGTGVKVGVINMKDYKPKALEDRDCVSCGQSFTPTKPNNVICSKACVRDRNEYLRYKNG